MVLLQRNRFNPVQIRWRRGASREDVSGSLMKYQLPLIVGQSEVGRGCLPECDLPDIGLTVRGTIVIGGANSSGPRAGRATLVAEYVCRKPSRYQCRKSLRRSSCAFSRRQRLLPATLSQGKTIETMFLNSGSVVPDKDGRMHVRRRDATNFNMSLTIIPGNIAFIRRSLMPELSVSPTNRMICCR